MGIQALVACSGKLLLVDLTEHRVQVVEDHRDEYYGISWPHDGSRLCLSHSGLDNGRLVSLESYLDSEKGRLSLGQVQSTPFLSQPHQILCTDEHIIATNTGRNCVAVVRIQDLFYKQHWPSDVRWDRTSKENAPGGHLNSLFLDRDRLYVVAHNHKRPSQVMVLSWPDMALIEQIDLHACGAHNIWHEGPNRLVVCDSMQGRILDVRSQKTLWQAYGNRSILRGVARHGNRLWVGGSAFTTRENRKASEGIIYVLDPQTWELKDEIELLCSGSVNEIRLINEVDACHHGFPLLQPVPVNAEATAQHQQSVQKAREQTAHLRGWSLQFGEVRMANAAAIALVDETLALVTCDDVPPTADIRLDGRITIPRGATAQHHIDFVARYRGPADQDMVAGLIYRLDGWLRVDIWRQCDGAWSLLANARVASTAQAIRFTFIAAGPDLKVLVEGKLVLQAHDPKTVWPGLAGVRGTSGKVEDWTAKVL